MHAYVTQRMGVFGTLREVVGQDSGPRYECRVCGTQVPDGAEKCPRCGSTEVAEYTLS
ncbi:MAG: zinc-ribbon domain-containing protein [Haloarculaceae archaeon]